MLNYLAMGVPPKHAVPGSPGASRIPIAPVRSYQDTSVSRRLSWAVLQGETESHQSLSLSYAVGRSPRQVLQPRALP